MAVSTRRRSEPALFQRYPRYRGLDLVDGTKLTLEEWLHLSAFTPDLVHPSFAFPTDEMRVQYLASLPSRETSEVIGLLRRLLVHTCTTKLDQISFDSIRGLMSDEECSRITGETFRRQLCGEPAWEGITWILDLLPDEPAAALGVIDQYEWCHLQRLDRDYWIHRLVDARAVIRARFIEHKTPSETLQALDPRKFERVVSALLAKLGFRVRLTQRTHDGGVDIHAETSDCGVAHNALVQCKRTGKSVGVTLVRELHGVVANSKACKGMLVTTSTFTSAAKDWARSNSQLELVDVTQFQKLMNAHFGVDWLSRVDSICPESEWNRRSLSLS